MTEAVFTFTKSSLSAGEPHSSKVTTHWALLLGTAAAHALGYYAIYYTKEANNKPHLTSIHACLGCIAGILLWIQLGGGIFARYPNLLKKFVSLKSLRAGHSLTGSVTYTAGMLALICSLGTLWYKTNAGTWSIIPALLLHLLLIFSAFKGHAKKYFSSRKWVIVSGEGWGREVKLAEVVEEGEEHVQVGEGEGCRLRCMCWVFCHFVWILSQFIWVSFLGWVLTVYQVTICYTLFSICFPICDSYSFRQV